VKERKSQQQNAQRHSGWV